MTKITCPCSDCIYNSDNHICKAKSINLTCRSMVTVNNGLVDMWICDKYKLSPVAEQIFNGLLELMKEDPPYNFKYRKRAEKNDE